MYLHQLKYSQLVLTCWWCPQEYLPQHKVDGDGRLIHALPCGPPQQLHISLQVVPKELWQVTGTDTHLDKLGQPLHGILGDYKVQSSESIEVAFTSVWPCFHPMAESWSDQKLGGASRRPVFDCLSKTGWWEGLGNETIENQLFNIKVILA